MAEPMWAWCIAGLVLLGLEVALGVPVVLLFFAVASFVTALASGLGLVMSWPAQALFAALSALVSLALFRQRLLGVTRRKGIGQAATLGEPVGTNGLALDCAAPGASLRIELFGVPWRGKNVGTARICKGAAVTVVLTRGLTLDVVDADSPRVAHPN